MEEISQDQQAVSGMTTIAIDFFGAFCTGSLGVVSEKRGRKAGFFPVYAGRGYMTVVMYGRPACISWRINIISRRPCVAAPRLR